MISRIRGTLLRREVDVAEVLTPGGVAYHIEIPVTTYERLPRDGAEVELLTHQVVRDDAVALYGFTEAMERTLFAHVLAVSGVGPRLALALLSHLRADGLVRAISQRDVTALRQVPGVGRKLAERLPLELADKFGEIAIAIGVGGAAPGGRAAEDAVGALVALGYSQQQAVAAVRRVLDSGGPLEGSALIKAALSVVAT